MSTSIQGTTLSMVPSSSHTPSRLRSSATANVSSLVQSNSIGQGLQRTVASHSTSLALTCGPVQRSKRGVCCFPRQGGRKQQRWGGRQWSREWHVEASNTDPEPFQWKGGGANLAEDWEEPGLYIEAPADSRVKWFFIDTNPDATDQQDPPIVFIAGIPAYSFLWREVIDAVSKTGRRVITLDLPGFGNSTAPDINSVPFKCTFNDYVAGLDYILTELLGDGQPIEVVAQGFLGGTVGALWAGRNLGKCSRITLMNTPLDPNTAGDLPTNLKGFLNPFLGPIQAQNPLQAVGKPIEAAGPYALDPNDQAAYMKPSMERGNAGFVLIAVLKELKKNGPAAVSEVLDRLGAPGAPKVRVAWGDADRWMGSEPPSSLPDAWDVVTISGAGHFAAEDWSEKVIDAIV